MSSIDTWSPWVAISFLGGPMLLAALTLAYNLYLTHRYLDAIKDGNLLTNRTGPEVTTSGLCPKPTSPRNHSPLPLSPLPMSLPTPQIP